MTTKQFALEFAHRLREVAQATYSRAAELGREDEFMEAHALMQRSTTLFEVADVLEGMARDFEDE
jgi:hypothetical protein